MNTGLQDAYNLCWKLAFVLRKQANTSLLDTYNEERLPFARWLLKFTDRGFNMMTSDNWFIRLFRKYIVLNLVGKVLASRRIRPFIFKIISQTGYSYKGGTISSYTSHQKLLIKACDRLPYFSEENIYPFFTEASFHMLHIDSKPLDKKLQESIKKTFPFSIIVVENQLTHKWKNLGVKSELFILVRPDNYIALIYDSYDEADIRKYLKKYWFLGDPF